jgi:hypothetical protein
MTGVHIVSRMHVMALLRISLCLLRRRLVRHFRVLVFVPGVIVVHRHACVVMLMLRMVLTRSGAFFPFIHSLSIRVHNPFTS